MSTHDVIDNRNTKLIDHLRRIMDSTEAAKFAVGYFFLSGFAGIADKLEQMKELRLLIGNTTNRETLEQLDLKQAYFSASDCQKVQARGPGFPPASSSSSAVHS